MALEEKANQKERRTKETNDSISDLPIKLFMVRVQVKGDGNSDENFRSILYVAVIIDRSLWDLEEKWRQIVIKLRK